ncbi:hypothetical protein DXG01_009231, partial [Tephrocybe rancida]
WQHELLDIANDADTYHSGSSPPMSEDDEAPADNASARSPSPQVPGRFSIRRPAKEQEASTTAQQSQVKALVTQTDSGSVDPKAGPSASVLISLDSQTLNGLAQPQGTQPSPEPQLILQPAQPVNSQQPPIV